MPELVEPSPCPEVNAAPVSAAGLPWTRRQVLLALLLMAASVGAMHSAWSDWYFISSTVEEHSHVFLVVPFGAAILYVNRRRLGGVAAGPSWVGPVIIAVGGLLALDGFNYAHQSFYHIGAVLVTLGAALTVLGHGVLLRFWPVFLMLGFMVPMPNRLRLGIANPLQYHTARISEAILTFFGEPVGRNGSSLTVNGKEVTIVEACNGLRMVFTLILVSWLFAFITPLKGWIKWLIILLSPVTALLCNVIRLIPTLLFYGHASQETADRFHDYSGWAMVPVAFILLLLVISLVEALGFEVRDKPAGGAAAVTDQGLRGESSPSVG